MDHRPVTSGYRALLSVPDVRRAFVGSCAARLSYAVLPLALILLVRDSTSSFASAGLVTGTFSLTVTVLAPARARLLDRMGQRYALERLVVGYTAILVALLGVAEMHGGFYLFVAFAAAAGALAPPLGPAMRVLWARMLRHREGLLQTAYAFDSVTEEVLFTTGPLLAGGLIALASPSIAMIAVIVLVCGGTVSFISAPATRAKRTEKAPKILNQHPLCLLGMRTIIISLAGVGIAVGMLEITLPAFAEHEGSSAAGGILLALFSAGSAVGGLYYGRRSWRYELSSRFVVLSCLFSVALLPLAFARSLPQAGFLVAAAGLAVAPLFTSAYLLVDRLVTRLSVAPTEANTWVSTANNGGAALGSAVAGLTLESVGLTIAFACVFVIVGGTALVTAVRRSTLAPLKN